MTGTQSLEARVALGVAGGGLGLALTSIRSFLEWPARRFDRIWLSTFLGLRLALYVVVFGGLHIAPRGDVPAIYTYEARRILSGSLPYRGFYTSYAPLHPYMDAALLLLWNSPLVLILFAILVEAAASYLWLRIGRSFLPERTLRLTAVLSLTFPVTLHFVAIDGQDNVLIALALLAALFLLQRKPFVSGVVLGAAALVVKFLSFLYVPVFWFAAARKLRWSTGFLLPVLLGYGAFALLHAPLLVPLQYEGSIEGSGNLPYTIEALSGLTPNPRLLDACVALLLIALLGFFFMRFRSLPPDQVWYPQLISWVALTLTVLVFSKKSWPPYLALVLFPLCLVVVRSGMSTLRILCFELFGVVTITEHSFWSTIMHQIPAPELHHLLRSGDAGALVMIGLELLLIAGYLFLLIEALRQLADLRPRRANSIASEGIPSASPLS